MSITYYFMINSIATNELITPSQNHTYTLNNSNCLNWNFIIHFQEFLKQKMDFEILKNRRITVSNAIGYYYVRYYFFFQKKINNYIHFVFNGFLIYSLLTINIAYLVLVIYVLHIIVKSIFDRLLIHHISYIWYTCLRVNEYKML